MGTKRVGLALGSVVLILSATALHADDNFNFRLSPGPRLVGTRADSSGSGQISAKLSGDTLVLDGSYRGLLGAPTAATLLMGPAPGVRGPKIAALTISSTTSGTINGSVKLRARELSAFRRGGLYIEIDSAEAPEGDLWGWLLPPSE
jgi:hypothetical protein